MGGGRVDCVRATPREGYVSRWHRIIVIVIAAVVVEGAIGAGHEGTVGRIVEVLGLLANTIVASILKTTLDAALAGTLIA